jgi:hypothetical protein
MVGNTSHGLYPQGCRPAEGIDRIGGRFGGEALSFIPAAWKGVERRLAPTFMMRTPVPNGQPAAGPGVADHLGGIDEHPLIIRRSRSRWSQTAQGGSQSGR